MAYGISVNNDSGGLVVDSNAHGLHYIGQASFIGNTTVTNNSFIRNRTRRRYSITLSSAASFPAVAIRPAADRWMSLGGVKRSAAGSSTWYIDLYSADSSMLAFNTTDMTGSASAEVHVFASGVASGDAFGLRLYDAAGNVSWDFGAKPLLIKQVAQFPQRTDRATYRNGDSVALPGVSIPLLLNASEHGKDNVAIGAVGTHEDSEYVFQLDGSGGLKRVLLGTYKEFGETGGSAYTPQPDWALPARNVFVIDLANYT